LCGVQTESMHPHFQAKICLELYAMYSSSSWVTGTLVYQSDMSTFSSSCFVWLSTLLCFVSYPPSWMSGSWSTIDHNTFDLNPLLRAGEVSARLGSGSFPCNLLMMCPNHSWADEVSGMFGAGPYKKLLKCTNHLWANEVSGMFCSWPLPFKLLLQIISATVSLVQTTLLFSFSSRIGLLFSSLISQ